MQNNLKSIWKKKRKEIKEKNFEERSGNQNNRNHEFGNQFEKNAKR